MNRKRYFVITFPPGIFGILVICFVFLKLSHDINWPWIYILSPIIIGTLISLFCHIKKSGKRND